VRRWTWLIILMALIPTLVLAARLKPTYTASARVQLTAPPAVDVALFPGSEPYRNMRDELTVARIDFIEAAKSSEVRMRTVAALGSTDADADADYALDIKQVRDSDFVDVIVSTRSAALAERTANTHAEVAIDYSSELRALPAKASVAFLSERLGNAQAELDSATREASTAMDQSRSAQVVQAAQQNLQFVQGKLSEAQLKGAASYSAQAMQIAARAAAPLTADTRKFQALLLMTGVGGLVAGAVAALALDAFAPYFNAVRRRVQVARADAPF